MECLPFSLPCKAGGKLLYVFDRLACYGRSERLTVTAEVYGTNNDGDTIQLISEPVYCENGVTQTVVFKPSEKQSEKVKNIFKFDSVFVRLTK